MPEDKKILDFYATQPWYCADSPLTPMRHEYDFNTPVPGTIQKTTSDPEPDFKCIRCDITLNEEREAVAAAATKPDDLIR